MAFVQLCQGYGHGNIITCNMTWLRIILVKCAVNLGALPHQLMIYYQQISYSLKGNTDDKHK